MFGTEAGLRFMASSNSNFSMSYEPRRMPGMVQLEFLHVLVRAEGDTWDHYGGSGYNAKMSTICSRWGIVEKDNNTDKVGFGAL